MISYIIIGIYTFILMLFCSGASPIIDFIFTDSAVFQTIGKAMTVGKIPYVDLFDHKGVYIYFINYLGYLIQRETGVWLIEALFWAINGILVYRIIREYVEDKGLLELVSMLWIMVFLNYFTFLAGNSVETYGVTFQLLSILLVIKQLKKNEVKHSVLTMFIHGICVGIVLCLRANLVLM